MDATATPDTSTPSPTPHVLVTGVTGFIGSAIATRLLQAGYVVHGTHRPRSANLVPTPTGDAAKRMRLFTADLLQAASYDTAARGCRYAIHAASPHESDVRDVRDEVITPAVNGTQNVLSSCLTAGVHKVIVISSYMAITGKGERKALDESNWNTTSTATDLPIHYAKTEAEKVAWRFANEAGTDAQKKTTPQTTGTPARRRPQVVVLNPAVVWGRSTTARLNTSKKLLVRIAGGEMPGIIDLAFPVVHVRDVAESTLRLMEAADASGRYICCGEQPLVHVRDIITEMRAAGMKPAKRNLCNRVMTHMVKMSSHIVPGGLDGQFVRHNVGNPVLLSNRKIVSEMGVSFIDVRTTLRETVEELLEKGYVDKSEPPAFDASKLQGGKNRGRG